MCIEIRCGFVVGVPLCLSLSPREDHLAARRVDKPHPGFEVVACSTLQKGALSLVQNITTCAAFCVRRTATLNRALGLPIRGRGA
jgi:hypothetical protein